MVKIPQIDAPIMSYGMAEELTQIGLYHGTALYHMEPGGAVDAETLAARRWNNPLLLPFGGLYVTTDYNKALRYARGIANIVAGNPYSANLPPDIDIADIASVVYTIRVLAGCEYALDEDYVGWEYYADHHEFTISTDFLGNLAPEEVEQLEKLQNRIWEAYSQDVPPPAARVFFDYVTKKYAAQLVEDLYEAASEPSIRLLNDNWEIIDATEVI